MPSPYQQGIDIAPPGDDDPDYREVDVVGFRENDNQFVFMVRQWLVNWLEVLVLFLSKHNSFWSPIPLFLNTF